MGMPERLAVACATQFDGRNRGGPALAEDGWQPDPFGRHELRYRSGTVWTEHVSDGGVQGSDAPVPGPQPQNARRTEPTAQQSAPASQRPAGPQPLLMVTSHDEGKNAKVTVWPDRIERIKAKSMMSLSRANQDTEVIPIRSVSSVQAKKDGMMWTNVTVFASGNNINFRIRHQEAQAFKNVVMDLVLNGGSQHQAQPVPAAVPAPQVDLVDQIRRLGELRDQGLLTDEEFAAQKAKLLNS